MSPIAIQKQLATLNQVLPEVVKSKEAAQAFLISAGIIKKPANTTRDEQAEKIN